MIVYWKAFEAAKVLTSAKKIRNLHHSNPQAN